MPGVLQNTHPCQLPIHSFVSLLRAFLAQGWMDLLIPSLCVLGVTDQADRYVPLVRRLAIQPQAVREFPEFPSFLPHQRAYTASVKQGTGKGGREGDF